MEKPTKKDAMDALDIARTIAPIIPIAIAMAGITIYKNIMQSIYETENELKGNLIDNQKENELKGSNE